MFAKDGFKEARLTQVEPKNQSKMRSVADCGTEIRGVHIELAVVNRFFR